MGESAKVTSIEALRRFRPSMVKFQEQASAAVMTANSAAERTLSWLQKDQMAHWKKEIRRRQELLTRAKSELIRKQAGPSGEARPSVEEKKAVDKAKRALKEAEQKLMTTQRWIRTLTKAVEKYRGGVQPLGYFLRGEIPQGVNALEKMAQSLDDYVALEMPGVKQPSSSNAADERSDSGDSDTTPTTEPTP